MAIITSTSLSSPSTTSTPSRPKYIAQDMMAEETAEPDSGGCDTADVDATVRPGTRMLRDVLPADVNAAPCSGGRATAEESVGPAARPGNGISGRAEESASVASYAHTCGKLRWKPPVVPMPSMGGYSEEFRETSGHGTPGRGSAITELRDEMETDGIKDDMNLIMLLGTSGADTKSYARERARAR